VAAAPGNGRPRVVSNVRARASRTSREVGAKLRGSCDPPFPANRDSPFRFCAPGCRTAAPRTTRRTGSTAGRRTSRWPSDKEGAGGRRSLRLVACGSFLTGHRPARRPAGQTKQKKSIKKSIIQLESACKSCRARLHVMYCAAICSSLSGARDTRVASERRSQLCAINTLVRDRQRDKSTARITSRTRRR
jgi:hypothetical protein